MSPKDLFIRSGKNMRKAKARFILTALSLAVGAFTMTLALALVSSARGQIEESFDVGNPTAVLVTRSGVENQQAAVQTSEEAEQASAPQPLTLEDVKKIRAVEGVVSAEPVAQTYANALRIDGQEFKAPSSIRPFTVQDGKPDLVAGNIENFSGDALLLPELFADRLNISPEELVGKQVEVVIESFGRQTREQTVAAQVQGVVGSNESQILNYTYSTIQLNEKIADIDRQDTSEFATPPNLQYIQAKAVSEEEVERVSDAIQAAGYQSVSISELSEEALKGVNALLAALLGIAGIAILASIFGVVNTQLMSVLERTREIGLMKAVGMPRGAVLKLFSLEAGWLGFVGSITGIILSLPVMFLISRLVSSEEFSVIIAPTLLDIVIVIVTLVAIAIIAGLLPALKAARLDPVEALRNE